MKAFHLLLLWVFGVLLLFIAAHGSCGPYHADLRHSDYYNFRFR